MPENRGSGYSAGVDKSTSFDAFVIQERGYEKKSAFMPVSYTHLDVYKRQLTITFGLLGYTWHAGDKARRKTWFKSDAELAAEAHKAVESA